MHTVEQLQEALALAEALGYGIRHEWLDGGSGGSCEIAGRKWLFVDLALSPLEQLDQVVSALRADPLVHTTHGLSAQLQSQLGLRKSA